jgi:hypothetical protein
MRLDNMRIKKWADLADAFLKQYKFNLEIATDRTSLMTMEKGNQESVRAYGQRWRDQAIHVHLMGSSAQHLYDAVRIAERIEQGIRSGRIMEPVEKKGFVGKRKETEVNGLEGSYKGKKKTIKITKHLLPKSLVSILLNPLSQTNPIKQNSQQITKVITKGETTNNQKNSYHPCQ